MNTKKLVALLLVLCMVLTLMVGCEKNTEKSEDNSKEEATQEETNNEQTNNGETEKEQNADTSNKGYITDETSLMAKVEELLDTELYGDMYKSDNTSFISYHCELNYNNKQDYDLDYTIKLGDGSVIQMPITFAELEAKGWVLDTSNGDQELDPNHMTFGRIKNNSGKLLSVTAYNHTSSKQAFKNCTVICIDAEQFSDLNTAKKLDTAIDFTVCGSITNASTLEDIIDVLGNPTTFYCSFHYDNDGNYTYSKLTITYMQKNSVYNQIVFELSGDGNYITKVCYDVDPQ